MQKYMVVLMFDAGTDNLYLDNNNIIPALEIRGFEFTGFTQSKALRAELQNQPVFKGLAGPMWGGMEDGQPVVRYEAWAVFDAFDD